MNEPNKITFELTLDEAEALLRGLWPAFIMPCRERLLTLWREAHEKAYPDPWLETQLTPSEQQALAAALEAPKSSPLPSEQVADGED